VVPWIPPQLPELPKVSRGLSPRELVQHMLLTNNPPSAALQDIFIADDNERQLLLLFAEVAIVTAVCGGDGLST